jgi:serine/threonine-protein kinase
MTRSCPQCADTCDETHRFCPHCGFQLASIADQKAPQDPLIGRTLPGGYVVLDLVGIGGMGRVYRAEQKTLGRTVAVKVIHPHLLGDESASARFITEARAASRLNHPNSVGVIDFGKTDDGQLYLVMEFLRGRDLARVAYDEGPLPIPRILNVVRQTLSALAEAHHLGIVHRDLKPENIVLEPMRSGGDFVKVVDFGLAKMREGPRETNITSPGIICGTPDYMAPEQGRGAAIDARTDIYAIGVILFQLLTTRLPFEADSPTQVVLMHLTLPPPDPRHVAPERNIPEALSNIVLRTLSKEPDERYATADDLSDALAALEPSPSMRAGSLSPPMACPSCGQPMLRSQKFCAECGNRISVPPTPPATPSRAPGAPGSGHISIIRGPLPLTHREDDLQWVTDRWRSVRGAMMAVRLLGVPGVGKSRLLREFLERARKSSDVVVETGPDPWWAEASYHAVRRAIAALADINPATTSERDWTSASPEARRGLFGLFGRTSDSGNSLSVGDRRYTAAEALRWALARAAARAGDHKVVLAIDDLNLCDGASRNAFADMLAEPPLVPGLLIATHTPNFDPGWAVDDGSRALSGLPAPNALALAKGQRLDRVSLPPPDGTTDILPLYIDQLVAFVSEGGSDPPARLADLMALRIERLAPASRRVLQAVAVLGDDVAPEDVETLVPAGPTARAAPGESQTSAVLASISALVTAQLLDRGPSGLRHTHPLSRQIALGSIPAAVRRDLHARAARIAEAKKLPLEVRAMHSLEAQDAFEALLLVEQVAERALGRGDASGAAVWLNRGLEFARRELFRGELDDPMRAVLIFSRKLGEALTAAGDLIFADGVLREALDIAGPSGPDRARVLRALAKVAHDRARSGEAMGLLSEALEHATRSGEHELVESLEDLRRAWAS